MDNDINIDEANSAIAISSREHQNELHRDYMEDYILIKDSFQKNHDQGLFCIFDGHGGDQVTKNISKYFALFLDQAMLFAESVEKALKTAFLSCDSYLQKSVKIIDKEGSTANVVFTNKDSDKKYAYIASVGDSPCFLVYKEKTLKITINDNCSNIDEINRVKEAGALVFNHRVFGTLSLTRAIGDIDYRKFLVNCIPKISNIEINCELLYIVLGSDGVLEDMTNDQVMEICWSSKNSKMIARSLIDTALKEGSQDNLSCIAIHLNY